jgi:hypothetical protein
LRGSRTVLREAAGAIPSAYSPIALLWKVPRFLYKRDSTVLVFALLNSVIAAFKSLKVKVITTSIFILGVFFAIVSSAPMILETSIAALFGVLIFSYVRTFLFVFKPSVIFELYKSLIEKTPGFVVDKGIDRDVVLVPISRLEGKQLSIWRTNVQTLVIWNRLLLFFARGLREYQESKLAAVAYAMSLLLLLGLTVLCFAAINLALFKLDSAQFSVMDDGGIFGFTYYSFHLFIFGGIPEITPIGDWSRVVSMSEQVFAILLLFILVSLFISVKGEKYKEELATTITSAENTGGELEALIIRDYHLSREQALEEIRKIEGNLLGIIMWLSRDL